jgi:predicted DNA-binding protein (MmcQ/YjbR family)
MNIEVYRAYCLAKLGTTEGFPFDEKTLVFKVMGKMFALTDVDSFESVNLKCDPDRAVQLREQFDFVLPGYHMSKKHWNTILVDLASDQQLMDWIDHSYALIVSSLPKKTQEELANL